jgi:hypothetical protein
MKSISFHISRQKDVIPSKTLMAVDAQNGSAKSTKPTTEGSPTCCNKQAFHHKKHNGIFNQ